ncbi:hypothetical protein [Polaribacter sp.]|jgi:hypothetical protein|uniref:hypothetical protein n=1 Tax=Polaribacter sp. TaxID=1920175 RepID=UPI003EEECADE
MNTHADKTQENKTQSVSALDSQMQSDGESTFQFVDNRPEAVAQLKLQEMANNSSQVKQLEAFQEMANNSPQANQAAQLQAMADGEVVQLFSMKKFLLSAMVASGHLLSPESFAGNSLGGGMEAGSDRNWQNGESPFALPENEDLLPPLLDDLADMYGEEEEED